MLRYASGLAGDNQQLASVIIKELLHYDILHALSQTPLVDQLVFQGGTALRLCYGGNRYSEDLDFVCPEQANPGQLNPEQLDPEKTNMDHWQQFERVLKHTVDRSFGCEVVLQAAKAGGGDHVAVERRQARVYLPAEVIGQPRTERINIEVARLPAWDASFRFIHSNHPLQTAKAGYGDILLQVESEAEILADKVVALAGRPYLKARDVWDLNWLLQKGVEVDEGMVAQKAERYGLGSLPAALQAAVQRLHDPHAHQQFRQEMSRFLLSASARHLASEKFVTQFFDTAVQCLQGIKPA
jgi:predicted nucleotidyltransferase component of viral defense system